MGTIEKRGKNSWRVGVQVQTERGWEWVRRTIKMPPGMSEARQHREAEKALARLILSLDDEEFEPPRPRYTLRSLCGIVDGTARRPESGGGHAEKLSPFSRRANPAGAGRHTAGRPDAPAPHAVAERCAPQPAAFHGPAGRPAEDAAPPQRRRAHGQGEARGHAAVCAHGAALLRYAGSDAGKGRAVGLY